MNHLEPLSWPAPLLRDGLDAHGRESLLRQRLVASMSMAIRSAFRVIGPFVEGCRRSVPAAFLAGPVHAARGLAGISLELAAELSLVDESLRPDWVRCLQELEALAASLSAGASVAHRDLAHSLDTVIVLLMQLDGAAEALRGLGADGPSADGPEDHRKGRASRRLGPRLDDLAPLMANAQ